MLDLHGWLLACVNKLERPVFPVALDLVVIIFAANEGLGIQDCLHVCLPPELDALVEVNMSRQHYVHPLEHQVLVPAW